MKVLSLFDGMACGALALQAAGIEIESYGAFEIDKYAIKTASHNFPFIVHHGNVFEADFSKFEGVDLVCGGSPCTYWSIAQKNNRETEASGAGWELFQQYVRAIKEAKPKFFVYENNKSMSKAIRQSIDEAFGFEAVLINSALVSAQNRQRLYWVGKRNADGTYSKVDIAQPEDRGILLKDVLDGVTERIPPYGNEDKARPINALYPKNCGGFEHRLFSDNPNKQQCDLIIEPVNITPDGKSQTIKAQYQKTNEHNICCYSSTYGASGAAEPVRIGTYPNNAKNQDKHDSQQYRIYSTEGKGVTLCGNGGGMGAKTGLYAIPVEFDGDIPTKAKSGSDGKIYRVYEVKDGLITIKGKQYEIDLEDGFYIIRKLTVSECKRLQTVPEWYEFPVSDSQAYKMLGNGWTVLVIAHIFTHLKELTEDAC